MKALFFLMLSVAVGMGAVFGKLGDRKHYPAGPRDTKVTPTPTVIATESPTSPVTEKNTPLPVPCVIDWALPVTSENVLRNSDCYRLLYFDPVTETFPGAPPFCPPNYSEWEQFFDQLYLRQACYPNLPTETPTPVPYPLNP